MELGGRKALFRRSHAFSHPMLHLWRNGACLSLAVGSASHDSRFPVPGTPFPLLFSSFGGRRLASIRQDCILISQQRARTLQNHNAEHNAHTVTDTHTHTHKHTHTHTVLNLSTNPNSPLRRACSQVFFKGLAAMSDFGILRFVSHRN